MNNVIDTSNKHHIKKRDHKRILLYIVIAAVAVCLIFMLAQSFWVKPTHDDFFFSTPVDSSSVKWNWDYWNRNGRLSDTFLYSILYPIPHIIQIFPVITIILLGAALFVFARASRKYLLKIQDNNYSTLIDSSIALLGVVTCLLTVPSIYASYYWVAGGIPHTWSFILLIAYASLLIRSYFHPKRTLGGDLLAFLMLPIFIALLYEAVAIALLVIPAILIAYGYIRKHKAVIGRAIVTRAMWLTLIAGAVGVAVARFSPGALDRYDTTVGVTKSFSSLLPGFPHNYISSIGQIFSNTNQQSLFLIMFTLSLIVSVVFLNTKINAKEMAKTSLWVILIGFSIVSIDIAAVWFGTSETFMIRSYFVVSSAVTISALVAGLSLGQFLRNIKNTKRSLITGIFIGESLSLLVANMFFAPYLATIHGQFLSYSRHWNQQNAKIMSDKQNSYCHVYAPRLLVNGTAAISSDPTFWMNHEMDRYYGVSHKINGCGIIGQGDIQNYFLIN